MDREIPKPNFTTTENMVIMKVNVEINSHI
jgi:hypothetical protein